jgi:hypothetical protein
MAAALIVFGLALHASPPRLIEGVAVRAARMPAWAFGLTAGALILFIDALRPEGVQAFIYFRF